MNAALTDDEWAILLAALVTYAVPGTPEPTPGERQRVRVLGQNLANQMPSDGLAWWAGALFGGRDAR